MTLPANFVLGLRFAQERLSGSFALPDVKNNYWELLVATSRKYLELLW
jgi:hypothetical protein